MQSLQNIQEIHRLLARLEELRNQLSRKLTEEDEKMEVIRSFRRASPEDPVLKADFESHLDTWDDYMEQYKDATRQLTDLKAKLIELSGAPRN